MGKKILAVDDDAVTLAVVRRYLERAGFQVITASSGEEGINLVRREMPQLAILDVVMPDIDGWAVLKQLQESELTKSIPVIMVSGNPDLLANDEFLHRGAAALMVKPINPEQLIMVIRRLVQQPVEPQAPKSDVKDLGESVLPSSQAGREPDGLSPSPPL